MHGAAYVPPFILLDIKEQREEVQNIKAILRSKRIEVDDHSEDIESPQQTVQDPPILPPKSEEPVDKERLEQLWQVAVEAYREQDWEQAIALLEEVSSINTRYKEVRRLLDRSKKNFGLLIEYRRLCALEDYQWRDAKKSFESIRIENPDFADKNNLLEWIAEQEWCDERLDLAREYLGYRNPSEALEILSPLTDQFPNNKKVFRLYDEAVTMQQVVDWQEYQNNIATQRIRQRVSQKIAHEETTYQNRQEILSREGKIAAIVVIVLIILIIISNIMSH